MTVDFESDRGLGPVAADFRGRCLALLLDTMTKGREPALRLAQLGCLAALAAVAGQWTGAESGEPIWAGMLVVIECRSFSTPC